MKFALSETPKTGFLKTRPMVFYCRYLKSDRVVILINLCLALTVSYIIFLAGVDRTENKVNWFIKCFCLNVTHKD